MGSPEASDTDLVSSRKPLSIVKNSREFLDCTSGDGCVSWVTEINGKKEDEAKTMLGFLDTAYLVTYAVFMFVRCAAKQRFVQIK